MDDQEMDEQEMDEENTSTQATKKVYKGVTLNDLKNIENAESPLDNLSNQTKTKMSIGF